MPRPDEMNSIASMLTAGGVNLEGLLEEVVFDYLFRSLHGDMIINKKIIKAILFYSLWIPSRNCPGRFSGSGGRPRASWHV